MQRKWREAIDAAGTMTEEEMQYADVPWPNSTEELVEYLDALLHRDHDYGEKVYAVSMAAVAAFYYVARQLRISGLQASMADFDILRRIRKIRGAFRLSDYTDLLYPQHVTREHFPTALDILEEQKEWFQEEATKALRKGPIADSVRQHLLWLSMGQPDDNYGKALFAQYALSEGPHDTRGI